MPAFSYTDGLSESEKELESASRMGHHNRKLYDYGPFQNLAPILGLESHRKYVYHRLESMRDTIQQAKRRSPRHGGAQQTHRDDYETFRMYLIERWGDQDEPEGSDTKRQKGVPLYAEYETTFSDQEAAMPGTSAHFRPMQKVLTRLRVANTAWDTLIPNIAPRERAYLDAFATGLFLSVCYTSKQLPSIYVVSQELRQYYGEHRRTLEQLDAQLRAAGLGLEYWSASPSVEPRRGNFIDPQGQPTSASACGRYGYASNRRADDHAILHWI